MKNYIHEYVYKNFNLLGLH